jgi:hypothetical protein
MRVGYFYIPIPCAGISAEKSKTAICTCLVRYLHGKIFGSVSGIIKAFAYEQPNENP